METSHPTPTPSGFGRKRAGRATEQKFTAGSMVVSAEVRVLADGEVVIDIPVSIERPRFVRLKTAGEDNMLVATERLGDTIKELLKELLSIEPDTSIESNTAPGRASVIAHEFGALLIYKMRSQLVAVGSKSRDDVQAAVKRGAQYLRGLVDSGELLSTAQAEQKAGLSRQVLHQKCGRGELIALALPHDRRYYWPSFQFEGWIDPEIIQRAINVKIERYNSGIDFIPLSDLDQQIRRDVMLGAFTLLTQPDPVLGDRSPIEVLQQDGRHGQAAVLNYLGMAAHGS